MSGTLIAERHLTTVDVVTQGSACLAWPDGHAVRLAASHVDPRHVVLQIGVLGIHPIGAVAGLAEAEGLARVRRAAPGVKDLASRTAGTPSAGVGRRRQGSGCACLQASTAGLGPLAVGGTEVAVEVIAVVACLELGRQHAITADGMAVLPVKLADMAGVGEGGEVTARRLEGDAWLASDDRLVSLCKSEGVVVHNGVDVVGACVIPCRGQYHSELRGPARPLCLVHVTGLWVDDLRAVDVYVPVPVAPLLLMLEAKG